MAQRVHHILTSYDIHDEKRLMRVGKIMKDYGERVLKSVFECNLTDREFDRMKARVDGVIEHSEDSVRFYFLCGKCIAQMEVSGLGVPFSEDDQVVIS